MSKKDKHLKFKTGAHRENKDGKGRYDLLSPKALHRIAKRLEYGANKYGAKDWDKGLPVNLLIDSSLRHIFQYLNKENDEDHLASAVTNLMQIMHQEKNKKVNYKNDTALL